MLANELARPLLPEPPATSVKRDHCYASSPKTAMKTTEANARQSFKFVVPKKDKGNEREWGGRKELNFPLSFPLWKEVKTAQWAGYSEGIKVAFMSC